MKKIMNYKSNFHNFQMEYTAKHPNSLKMRSYLPPLKGKTVLDVGCGSGIDLQFFISMGPKRVAGSDISSELISIAKSSNPLAEIRNDTLSYLSWKDESFDVVWSKYALNCISDIISPLKEIYRVCKKNGLVLLQVTHPIRSLQFLKSQDYFDEKSIIEYPTSDGKYFMEPHHMFSSWLNSIIEAGFEILHCEEILNREKHEYNGIINPSAIIFILNKK